MMECSFEECGYPVRARGLCEAHYVQQRVGKTLTPVVRRKPKINGMKYCRNCDSYKGLPEFSKGTGSFGVSAYCAPCSAKRMRDKYHRGAARISEIKSETGCVDCGIDNPIVLDFDHLPGAVKCFTIGEVGWRKNWDVVLAEIAKCEVVCANCHRVRTANRSKGET